MLYFAYGSNLDEGQIKFRCPDSKPKFKARLDGFRLDFTRYSPKWQGGVADVVDDPGSLLWGFVYDLTKDDLKKLDDYEEGYYKEKINVIYRKKNIEVYIYKVINKQPYIQPSEKYINLIIKSAKKYRFHKHYIKFLMTFKNFTINTINPDLLK